MRKADYTYLADAIKKRIAHANWRTTNGTSERLREYARGQSSALTQLAEDFAENASVNQGEFLKACGLG